MVRVFRFALCWMITLSGFSPAAQNYRYPAQSAYLASMSGFPSVANPIVVAENPSLLSSVNKFSVSVYAENEYGVKGLNFLKLGAMVGSSRSQIGALASHFGNIDYREIVLGLHYGKSLGAVNVGTTFRYNYFYIRGINPESCFDYAVSASWKITERMRCLFGLANPYFFPSKSAIAIASCYSIAFGFAPSKTVFAETRFVKEGGKDFQGSIALHFLFADRWTFHTGCWPLIFRPFVGMEWQQSSFRLSVNVSYHPHLGGSPGLMVTYEQPNDEE